MAEEKLQIKADFFISQALKKIDELGTKILFIVDNNGRLTGSLTDGDIRRWILKKGNINAPVGKVYNRTPIFLNKDYDIKTAKRLMLKNKIERIPVVDKQRKILQILFWGDIFSGKAHRPFPKICVPVVVMAGGKGTRLDPLTNIFPKALIPFEDRTIAEAIMEKFAAYGCKEFYFILNYKGGMIKSYFDNTHCQYKINYIYEDMPLGTAGGLRLLPKMKGRSFILTNCDVIINANFAEIYDFHKKGKFTLTIIACARNFIIPYGVIELNSSGILSKILEKPEFHFMVNTGIYIINKEALPIIPEEKSLDMNELIIRLKNNGCRIGVYPVGEKAWLDIGRWEKYREFLNETGL